MKRKIAGLIVVSGLALVLVLLSASQSLAVTQKVSGSGSFTYVSSNFSYDFVNVAVYITGPGKDNLGGQFTSVAIAEYAPPSSTVCTAPDGTSGLQYDLVASNAVNTYKTGQIYYSAEPGLSTQCVSTTTGSFTATTVYTLAGGTDKFTNVSGTATSTATGTNLALGAFGGAGGVFGAGQFTSAGSITK
jgi:hypothetical protein